jgi:S-DNA-T family DNA segregation ATPase FtsK/SpoIIIE
MADRKMTKEKGMAAETTKKGGKSAGNKKNAQKRTQANPPGSKTKSRGEARESEEPLSASMKEEIVLAVTLLISVLFFLSYINLCGAVGKWLNTLVFGMFGIFGYLFPFLLFLGVAFFISNRKNRIVKRKLLCSAAFFLCFSALIELLSSYDSERTWIQYFTMSAEGKNGGGILGGTLVFLLCPLFDTVATVIILIILMIICLMVVTGKELFAYIKSITGESVQEYQFARMERRRRAQEEEEIAEEFLPGRNLPEESQRDRRVVVFQKPGGQESESTEKKEPVRFVDALKERGKKGMRKPSSPEEPLEKLPQLEKEDKETSDRMQEIPKDLENTTFEESLQDTSSLAIQEVAEVPVFEKEEVLPFYQEELKRKFGEELEDTAVERVFYDVNISERGGSVKENDGTLIRKDWYEDEEPLIPKRANINPVDEPQKEQESAGKKVQENIQKGAAKEPAQEFISADMIFAKAGIDPLISVDTVNTEKKKDAPSFSALQNKADIRNFWPDMSVQGERARASSGIRISAVSDLPVQSSNEKQDSFPEISNFSTQDQELEEEPNFSATEQELEKNYNSSLSEQESEEVSGFSVQDREREEVSNSSVRGQELKETSNSLSFLPPVPEKKYEFPPIELLAEPMQGKGANEQELRETAAKLESTLQSFGVRVKVNKFSYGPSVTQYELLPEQGVKVNQITKLSDDIKLNLAVTDIRIEAPIPGKAAVGIEVPNKENSPVILRELLESPEFKRHKSELAFAVGKNISGQIVVSDIAKMPHMLIAGATGSGKSVCINTIIMSILYKADPKEVKLIMVDPKVVELSVYNGIPHLLIPVVTDPKKASAALQWAVAEMTDRYRKFAALSVRDLAGYNAKVDGFDEPDPAFPRLPKIVIIVDELADLMMVAAANEVEEAICRLAQMARAAGLHLIIATQRPSVNVITGVIKANVPSRVAFAVTSAVDSRTILDGVGAERLLGKGDMLFFPSGYPKPVRIQGAFVSDAEVSAVVDFLKEQAQGMTDYNEEINQKIMSSGGEGGSISGTDGNDDYFVEAGRFIIEKQKASIGMLQRVYKIGFNRAARIMDQLTAAGVVGPEEGTKPRKILMTQTEFDEYLGRNL